MRWQVEAVLKQGLSRVPKGSSLYRWLQRRNGRLRTIDVDDYWPERGRVLLLAEEHGVPTFGSRIFEIGTGWHPVLGLVSALRGAHHVATVDLRRWMDQETLRAAASAALDIVTAGDDVDARRVACVEDMTEHPIESVTAALASLDIDYQAPADATDTGSIPASFDLVVHSDVFEHVPPATIDAMLAESRRILRPGGLHVARICPGDHFADRDRRITTAHHLRYSERSWRWIGGSGLAYHNRLRSDDFVRAFTRAGYRVLDVQCRIDERARLAIANGVERPHASFAHYGIDDLATTSMHIVARR
ncbi:MAG: methyltransferase domain-containing protein [Gemmatimonadaceae bacterium]